MRRILKISPSSEDRVNSGNERRFLRLCRAARLPEPEANRWIAVPDGHGFEVDFCWPAAGLIVEIDSRTFHRTLRAFENDPHRDRLLALTGWRVVRFTERDLARTPGPGRGAGSPFPHPYRRPGRVSLVQVPKHATVGVGAVIRYHRPSNRPRPSAGPPGAARKTGAGEFESPRLSSLPARRLFSFGAGDTDTDETDCRWTERKKKLRWPSSPRTSREPRRSSPSTTEGSASPTRPSCGAGCARPTPCSGWSRTGSRSGRSPTPVPEEIDGLLLGPTALTLIHGDAVIAAKAIADFAKEHSALEYKGGVMDGEVLDPEGFAVIARLPGVDALRGQLVGVAASPITGLVRGLGSMISGLAIALGQIAEQGLVTRRAAGRGRAGAASRRARGCRRAGGRGAPPSRSRAGRAEPAEEEPAAEAGARRRGRSSRRPSTPRRRRNRRSRSSRLPTSPPGEPETSEDRQTRRAASRRPMKSEGQD